MTAPNPAAAGSASRVVIALGGNAIAPAGKGGTADEQRRNIGSAMERVATLVAGGHEVVLTHGNGPQVGNLLLKNDLAKDIVPPMPLDWCVAQTQATIGATICTTLEEALDDVDLPLAVIPLISRVRVDPDDPAFAAPAKPVGRYLADEDEVAAQMERTGEQWVRQGERGWRRVVPSPQPVELLDGMSLRLVLGAGAVVVANGGGGIPMMRDAHGRLHGVEAVIDKDLSGVLLALHVGAEAFVVLTDVPGVAVDYGTSEERWLESVTPGELRALEGGGHFAAGSMGPKVDAVARFVEQGGTRAAIGELSDPLAVVEGRAGTQVVAETAAVDR